jgi:hypothetical protein
MTKKIVYIKIFYFTNPFELLVCLFYLADAVDGRKLPKTRLILSIDNSAASTNYINRINDE